MEDALLKRKMPSSQEAEQSVIGAMIIDSNIASSVMTVISKDDFYNKQYGLIFDAIVRIVSRGEGVDIVTLQNELRKMDAPPQVQSLTYLDDIVSAAPMTTNGVYYANIVKEKSQLRKLLGICESITEECYQDSKETNEIMEDAEKAVFGLTTNQGMNEITPISEIVVDAMKRYEEAYKNKGKVLGVPTGFTDLDFKLGGMQNSDLILLAARPSMGKTALALNIAEYVAFKKNMTVALFSLEMSKEQLINRFFAMEARVDAGKLRSGDLSDADWGNLVESVGIIGQSKLTIDDTPGISVPQIRSKCRRIKAESGLSLIIIDYLQLMAGVGRVESRQQEISQISRGLKQLARELDVPVIALSQLSRQVEQRGGEHRPMLSDLRESGAIEQDADVVMFIYRDDYYNKDSEKKGIAEINIAKHRNGPIGSVELIWMPQFTKFANLENR